MGSFKLYALLVSLAMLLAAGAWHKHVVHDRNHWHAQAAQWEAKAKVFKDAVAASENLRAKEAAQARAGVAQAQSQCDQRVAEARRSAGAIKRLMEKPRATDPVSHCPVPDLVPSSELRDALQPHPFRPAGTTPAR